MIIANAVDITDLVVQKYRININAISLVMLEEVFTNYLDEGSFGIVKVTFSDNTTKIYFDYPTDLTMVQGQELAKEILSINSVPLFTQSVPVNAESKNEPLTTEELTINAKLLYKQIQELYSVPENQRDSNFYMKLTDLWGEFRVVSGDLVRSMFQQEKL